MPLAPTYPGVYIEELPSGVQTITGVATSVTAFVGYTSRGRDNRATAITSFSDFQRSFGGLAADSVLSYAVQQYYLNGGSTAYVVRVPKHDAVAAAVTLLDGPAGKSALTLTALSKGAWANDVLIDVDYDGVADTSSFNLTITDMGSGAVETFPGVTMDSSKALYVATVLNDPDSGSGMVSAAVPDATAARPLHTGTQGDDFSGTLPTDKPYSILINADVPANIIKNLSVTLIQTGETLPSSTLGIARLFARRINAALSTVLPGAAVSVVPSSSGKGLRIAPDFSTDTLDADLDAELTFADGTPNSALELVLNHASANVGHYRLGSGRATGSQSGAVLGVDGVLLPQTADLIGLDGPTYTGIYALEKVDIFNLLCIPDATRSTTASPTTLDTNVDPNSIFTAAEAFCEDKNAFLLIDPPPNINNPDKALDWITSGLTVKGNHAAAYFPAFRSPDPLNNYQLRTFPPCGVVAGIYARTDAARGIWKAPAGTEATLTGVQSLIYKLTDEENGELNPLGLNCARTFPVYGSVLWGARTLQGADAEASQWKYIPVRRLASYIELSLFQGMQWVVFEPNDEPLWSEIRLNITAFMQTLFRQGAFQGSTPNDAYLVKCDSETTTQDDINRGVVNVVVGFAPLKPAEFVYLQIEQLAGQTGS